MNMTPINGVNTITPLNFNIVNPVTNQQSNTIQTNTSTSSNEAFMTDVLNAFDSLGLSTTSLLNDTSSSTSSDFSSTATSEALTQFVQSLQVTLNQLSDQKTSTGNNPTPPELQAGFNSFINDLSFLINNNDSGLQSNFDFLTSLLSNPSSTSQTPSLSDFLSTMLSNLENNIINQNSIGTSITTGV